MAVDLDELERLLGEPRGSLDRISAVGRLAIDELRRRRLAEALDGSTLERDDPTPVDPGRITVQIGEEEVTLAIVNGVPRYTAVVRRGREEWTAESDRPTCALANAVGLWLQSLRNRCSAERKAVRMGLEP